jgi:demethylmenaquinone methyltransferase/2-methoxy-6-polyprenyl-1,4-benzoquinol methylase
VQTELEALPFADATFDRILLVEAFHHVNDQRIALRELLRVLKPSGRPVIEEQDVRRLPVTIVALLEKLFLVRGHFKPPSVMMGMTAELRQAQPEARLFPHLAAGLLRPQWRRVCAISDSGPGL